VITRDTFLIDLLPGQDVSKPGRALESAGLHIVGDLLTAAATVDPCVRDGTPYRTDLQRVANVLREVPKLDRKAMFTLHDALIDGGLQALLDAQPLPRAAPGAPTPEPPSAAKPNGPKGEQRVLIRPKDLSASAPPDEFSDAERR